VDRRNNKGRGASSIGRKNNINADPSVRRITSAVDRIERTEREETEINQLVSRIYSTDDGRKLFDYLKSVTFGIVYGPMEMTRENQCALNHLEGQRYLVGVLEQRRMRGSMNE